MISFNIITTIFDVGLLRDLHRACMYVKWLTQFHPSNISSVNVENVHLVERELSLPNPINNVERVFDPPHEINIGAPALH